MDSVLKNVGGSYVQLFSHNLYDLFCHVYAQGDAATRKPLQTVLRTWREYKLFAPPLLDKIDAKLVSLNGGSQVLVNPDFVKPVSYNSYLRISFPGWPGDSE